MKTIIVATDYSSDANNAVKYAAALARYINSKIVLFNSFKLSVHAVNARLSASTIDGLIAANKKRLKDIAAKVCDTYGICVECVTRTSDFKEELDFQVERLKADLVVMGMSEIYSDNEYENTTTSIIRHARYPVLAIPENASFEGFSKILFAFDSGCICAENKLSLLKEVSAFFDAQVQIYHIEKNRKSIITTENNKNKVAFDIETLLNEVNHSYEDVTEDDVIRGIERGIKKSEADLLVMVHHKCGLWEGLLHKSKTSKMARRTHIPLLALPNPN